MLVLPERRQREMNVIEQFPGKNEIVIAEDVLRDFTGTIVVNGTGNRVVFERPFVCSDVYVEVSGDGVVEIGSGCLLSGQHIRLFAPGRITIGAGCAFNGASYLHMHETAIIQLGRDCLIAGGVSFSSSDVHKIIDRATGKRVNPPGDIIVGDHVWVSSEATLWAGAKVGNDSVVGRASHVSKEFPANCVIAGTPARIVRENVTWEA